MNAMTTATHARVRGSRSRSLVLLDPALVAAASYSQACAMRG